MVSHDYAVSHTEARMLGRKVKPSLVVCPPILVGHWTLEVSKFVGRDVLTPLGYEGNPSARAGQQKRFASVDVVVMSYDTLRADSAAILNHDWNYCVLDEGHVIRNPKAKITQVTVFGRLTSDRSRISMPYHLRTHLNGWGSTLKCHTLVWPNA